MKKRKARIILTFIVTLLAVLIIGVVVLIVEMGKGKEDSGIEVESSKPKATNAINNTLESSAKATPQKEVEQVSPNVTSKPKKELQIQTNGYKVAIDAGHQESGDSGLEPEGPGSSRKKAKVSSGAVGVQTGVPEYKLNLQVAKKIQKELLARGYEVCMTRTTNKVHISNKERAILVNDSGADVCIRIHADGVDSSSVQGASALYPSASNPYVGNLSKASKKLSEHILNSYCKATGIHNRGVSQRDDLTGTNWSEIPVTLIELGFLSSPSEDEKMQKEWFQEKMAQGIVNGIDQYFQNVS